MSQPNAPITELSQVDPDWLSSTLKANGHLTQGRIESVTHEILKKAKYSDIVRFRVTYSATATGEKGVLPPTALILKLRKPGGKTKRSALFARREFEFYSRVNGAMDTAPTARCYDAVFQPQSGHYHFLLEDLSATHAHVGNPLPPSVPECEQIVECVARFHAAWWDHPRVGTEIGRPFHEERHSKRADTIKKRTDKFLALLGDRISTSRRELLLDLCAVFPRLLERQSAGPMTITHGDAHFQNFLIAPGRTDCRIIDWEAWEIAPATDDMAFMMAVLWFSERRRRLEQDLLQRYHRALLASDVRDYSWDACWNDYRLSLVKHLCTPVYQWVNGVRPVVWWSNLERILTSYEDLGCAEILDQLKGK